ncbi:uncharacterized protein L201_000803 [Kwoniella dendrophila CBS 6074]|uniref:BTB domain-containing protein n=1 Tax=Kwoniella dendrophila CBS 6074 TaxID=1295534 RepID=A0AAX4JND5_9TREE
MPSKKRKAPSVIYHEFYNSPDDTVYIRSKDDIYFKANKSKLTRASTFFNDILDTSGPISCDNDEDHPIELDFTEKAITAYLDIVSISGSHWINLDYPTCKEVYAIGHFTMSNKAMETTRTMLGSMIIPLDSWDLLIFASDHNDINLGRSALISFGEHELCNDRKALCQKRYTKEDLTFFRNNIEKLRPSWQLALFHCLLDNGQVTLGLGTYDLQAGFLLRHRENVEDHFNPEKYGG